MTYSGFNAPRHSVKRECGEFLPFPDIRASSSASPPSSFCLHDVCVVVFRGFV